MTKVLVIDDSTTLRKLVEIAMRGSGIEIDFAATGNDGITRARSDRPDAILLDFLLPDLPSTEVCQRLSDDLATARVPIVVMSANQPSIFTAFQRFPAVVDFVGKPFTPAEIRSRLESAIRAPAKATSEPRARRPTMRPSSQSGPPPMTTGQLAAATKGVHELMAERLARLSAADRAKLSAEELVRALLDDTTVAALAQTIGAQPPPENDLELRGDLMTTPLLEVLRLLSSAAATGQLVIARGDTVRVYLRRGGILMCTSSAFDESAFGPVGVGAVPADVIRRARALQEGEGKPALVTLAQAGATRVSDLPALLHAQATKLLSELLGATAGRFAWNPNAAIPDYVDAFGRVLSITQIALARHRQGPDVALPPVFLDEVYDRTPRFSEKLGGTRLSGDEQRLLGLIDGRYTVREILGRAEISTDRAAAIFSRLKNVDLIRTETVSGVTDLAGGAVVVIDSDEDGFVGPLRAHLARRPQPIDVVSLPPGKDLASAMLKLRPRLVVLNARLVPPHEVAEQLAPVSRAGTIALTAVLDYPDSMLVDAMLAAGVHAVLTKPLHINELERLLSL